MVDSKLHKFIIL